MTSTAKAIAKGSCCVCGLDVHVAEDVKTGRQMVMHAMPMCEEFEKSNPDVFARRCDLRSVEAS